MAAPLYECIVISDEQRLLYTNKKETIDTCHMNDKKNYVPY